MHFIHDKLILTTYVIFLRVLENVGLNKHVDYTYIILFEKKKV